jgi:hypothetical protein
MPRSNRELAKRKIASAINRIDHAGTYMQELKEMYVDSRPDISNALTLAQNLLEEVFNTMENLDKIA